MKNEKTFICPDCGSTELVLLLCGCEDYETTHGVVQCEECDYQEVTRPDHEVKR